MQIAGGVGSGVELQGSNHGNGNIYRMRTYVTRKQRPGTGGKSFLKISGYSITEYLHSLKIINFVIYYCYYINIITINITFS